MPLLRRRRPLLRAAAVGGGAYLAGKRHVQNQDEAAQREDQAYYEGQQSATAAAPAPAPAPGASSDELARLQQLGQLHDQGVLTDDEFAKEKQRIIGRV